MYRKLASYTLKVRNNKSDPINLILDTSLLQSSYFLWNMLKIVTCTTQLHVVIAIVAKHVPGVLFLVRFNNFARTTGFYWNCALLL